MAKAWNGSWSRAYNIICETQWSIVKAWVCMASSGTGLLVFSDDVTEHRSRRKNSEVYIGISDAQMVVISVGVAVDPLVGWVG